jgi:PKD repeat protein
MNKAVSGMFVVFILVSTVGFVPNIGLVKADGVPALEPPVEVLDFKNGTRELITDFGNGTRNCIAETFVEKTAELQVPNETDQSQISVPTGSTTSREMAKKLSTVSSEEIVSYANSTQTFVMTQPMMLGFTYTLAYWQEQWSQQGGWWIFSWYLTVGVDIDIQFGLRLPINVTVEYPKQMTVCNNYTIHATLDPIDKPDFNELLLTFKANIWAQADLAGINIPRTVLFGPDVDDSVSFAAPLGSHSAPLFMTLRINIFDIIEHVFPSLKGVIDVISYLVVPYLDVQPTFGSHSITAGASASGDARVVEGAILNWSEPHQTLNFTINADEYDPSTNYSEVVLSDFRYWFTNFAVDFALEFDFNSVINFFGIRDVNLHIYTLDMTWINQYIGTPSVGSHAGYPRSVYFTTYVNRTVNPPTPPPPVEDVAVSYASVYPSMVLAGQNVSVSIGVKNLGGIAESFNVTVYADNVTIRSWTVSMLNAGEQTEQDFDWNTTGFLPQHTYSITAEASTLPNEFDTDNNVLFVGNVTVVLPSPQANFTYSPVPPIQNQTTTFDASSSTSGGTIVSYEWDFGEGVNVTTANPITTYVFAYNGNHKVTLTVIDSNGLNDTMLEVIDVLQHDVAVTDVVPYRTWVYEGQTIKVNVTVVNNGDFNETIDVDLFFNITANQKIGTDNVHLASGENATLTFLWDTTDVTHCHNYTITACSRIEFDSNMTNNVKEGSMRIKVRILGDVNGDSKVDITDVALAAKAFGAHALNGTPRWLPWGPYADMDSNGSIDITDIALIAKNFGTTC